MKCFTLDRPGILCRAGKIEVGEYGRGRRLVRVPLPRGAVMETDIQGRDAPTDALLMECDGKSDTDALVLIPDQSGFRGSWWWEDAELDAPPIYLHPIAHGYCAQGQAGRAGGGPAYLVVMRDGHAVRLRRTGRLYGSPANLRLTNVDGTIVLEDDDARRETDEAAARMAEQTGGAA